MYISNGAAQSKNGCRDGITYAALVKTGAKVMREY